MHVEKEDPHRRRLLRLERAHERRLQEGSLCGECCGEDGDVVEVIQQNHKTHESGEELKGGDWRNHGCKKGGGGGERREEHGIRRVRDAGAHNIDVGRGDPELELRLHPLVVQHKAVVGADAQNDKQTEKIEKREVFKPEQKLVHKVRRGKGEDDLDHGCKGERQRPCVQENHDKDDADGAVELDHVLSQVLVEEQVAQLLVDRVDRRLRELALQRVVDGAVEKEVHHQLRRPVTVKDAACELHPRRRSLRIVFFGRLFKVGVHDLREEARVGAAAVLPQTFPPARAEEIGTPEVVRAQRLDVGAPHRQI
mmetsp:Transcript_22358/g.72539  ORF Transcript_22358/g.72539 Transcript_22358/m.72539 type:complete len:310 (-) Transcript_22358:699-1628(-)